MERAMNIATIACLMIIGALSIVYKYEDMTLDMPPKIIAASDVGRSNKQLCNEVAEQMEESVRIGLFTQAESDRVTRKCRRYFPPEQSH